MSQSTLSLRMSVFQRPGRPQQVDFCLYVGFDSAGLVFIASNNPALKLLVAHAADATAAC